MASQRSSPAIRTRIARRAACSSASHSGAHPAGRGLGRGQVAEEAQQVGRALDVAGVPVRGQPLQLTPRSRPAPPGPAARGSPPSRAARPAAWSPATAPRPAARPAARRIRRGTSPRSRTAGCARTATAPGWPAPPPHPPRRHVGHQLAQPGQVVDVLHALAHRFQGDRELLVAPGHGEQLRRALPLLPQRGAPLRVPAGQQQRPGRAFPEPGRVQRRRAQLGDHDLLHLVRLEQHVLARSARPPRRRRPWPPAAAARCRRRRAEACTSTPRRSRIRAAMASAHGPLTCAPNGECTTSRQSPSSSRNRSTRIVRSLGTCRVASRCSCR